MELECLISPRVLLPVTVYDFHATIDESRAPMEINFRNREDMAAPEGAKLRWALDDTQPFEIPGLSFFLRDGDAIFYTNSIGGISVDFDRATTADFGQWSVQVGDFSEPDPNVTTAAA